MQSLDRLSRTKGRIRENFFSLPNYLLAGTLVFSCVQAQTELMPFSSFQQPISGFLSIHNQLCELIPYNKHIKYKYNKYTYVYMFVCLLIYPYILLVLFHWITLIQLPYLQISLMIKLFAGWTYQYLGLILGTSMSLSRPLSGP